MGEFEFTLTPVTKEYLTSEIDEEWNRKYGKFLNYIRLYRWRVKYFG